MSNVTIDPNSVVLPSITLGQLLSNARTPNSQWFNVRTRFYSSTTRYRIPQCLYDTKLHQCAACIGTCTCTKRTVRDRRLLLTRYLRTDNEYEWKACPSIEPLCQEWSLPAGMY
jgi:hypothetical protein